MLVIQYPACKSSTLFSSLFCYFARKIVFFHYLEPPLPVLWVKLQEMFTADCYYLDASDAFAVH